MGELEILDWIHGASPMLDIPMLAVTLVSTYALIWFVIAFLMTCTDRNRRIGIAIIVSLVVTFIVVDVLVKPCIGRIRPFEFTDIQLIVDTPRSYSFPSGHSAYAFAGATVIAYYNRRWGIVALIFAAIVGFSRLYLYVHWPTDVIAGAIVGSAIALFCIWFLSRYVPYFRELPDPKSAPDV